MKEKILELLRDSGVRVLMNHRLSDITDVQTSDGHPEFRLEFNNCFQMMASKVIHAISQSVPSTKYLPASALDSNGYVEVLPKLVTLSFKLSAQQAYILHSELETNGAKLPRPFLSGRHSAMVWDKTL
jgi:hypothetical protein